MAFSRELAMAHERLQTDCIDLAGVKFLPHCLHAFWRLHSISIVCIARLEVFSVIVQGIRYPLNRYRYPVKGGQQQG
jgi:hypothetical protein